MANYGQLLKMWLSKFILLGQKINYAFSMWKLTIISNQFLILFELCIHMWLNDDFGLGYPTFDTLTDKLFV